MLNHVDLMAALTADYLNVFVLRVKEDRAEVIKLDGYVTPGITEGDQQNLPYSSLLRTYAQGRVFSDDIDAFLEKLSTKALLEAFSDGREHLEYDYRILDEGEIHHYKARYSRISKPDEDLRIVLAFRNIDSIISIGREQRIKGLFNAYSAISSIFYSLHRVDIQGNTYTEIKASPIIKQLTIQGSNNYDDNAVRIISGVSSKWSRDDALRFVDRSTLEERMEGKTHIMMEFVSYAAESCRLHFFKEDADDNGKLQHVIFGVEMVQEEENQAVINVLSRDYQNVFYIDLEKGSSRILKMQGIFSKDVEEKRLQKFSYDTVCKEYIVGHIHPEDREMLEKDVSLEHLREVFSSDDELTGSCRTLADGEIHHFRYVYLKLANLNAVVAGFRNIDDVIAQHEAEERAQRERELAYQKRLEEQLAIFDTLAHNFKNVYLVNLKDSTARVLKLEDEHNDNRLDHLLDVAFPYEALLNAWIGEAVHPDDKETLKKELSVAHLRKVFAKQEEYIGNYRMLVDGRTIHYQFSVNLMQDKVHIIAGFQNVDHIVEEHLAQERKEREMKEAQLRGEKEHAEVISAVSTIYSTIFRAEIDTHRFEVLNSVPLMGTVAGDSGNWDEKLEQVISAFMAQEVQDHMREFLDLGTLADRLNDTNTISTEYKDPSGAWFESRFIVKRRDEGGIVKEVLYVARDITTEKLHDIEQQEQLAHALAMAQQANKAKSTFLNSMSHDIRTPMNAIIGFTALAQTHMDDKAQVQDYLAKIGTSSTHLLSLINDILDMSRIESGTVKLDEKPVHIPDLFHDLRTMIQGLVNSKNLNLFIDT